MVEYRKVTPEEKLYVSRLQSIVFSDSGANEEAIRERIAKGEYDSSGTYGAVGENGQIFAGMEVIPYTMWFDGQRVDMYGIGGVASAPETRRMGHIRKIFEKVMGDIYEKGAVFSHLYPFSHDYYRKFGYEPAGSAKKYTLPLGPARALKTGGTACDFLRGDKAGEELAGIYEAYASRHNMMVSRSRERWNEVFDISLFGENRLYYWKNADSKIKSWAKFKKNGNTIEIRDIAWADHEGMLGILQFIGMFDGAAENLSIKASPEFIPELYWNNLYDIEISNDWQGMSRVVNVKRALELMKKPAGEGKFTIKVNDDFAGWNNHTYEIEYGGGECGVKAVNKNADAETSARALVPMILGLYEFEQIANKPDVCVFCNMQILKQAFPKKNLLIADYF